VLLVPNRAVRVVDGQRVVYILVDNELVPVDITLGSSSDSASEVVDGDLTSGDIIVLNPPQVFDTMGGPFGGN
jgi:HlyD family secretion protein